MPWFPPVGNLAVVRGPRQRPYHAAHACLCIIRAGTGAPTTKFAKRRLPGLFENRQKEAGSAAFDLQKANVFLKLYRKRRRNLPYPLAAFVIGTGLSCGPSLGAVETTFRTDARRSDTCPYRDSNVKPSCFS